MAEALNYKHLHYFWAVAREGSVSRAAERLGMSPQTVSGQISKLEQNLGRALFRQQGRSLELTEAGRVAQRFADQIFLLGENLCETLADDTLDKTVRLSAGIADVLPKAIARRLLQPALALEQPLRLSCQEGDFDELLGLVSQHRIDLMLTDRPLPAGAQQSFQCWLLARCPVTLFGAPDLATRYRPGFPRSLERAPLLLPSRDNVQRGQLEHWFEQLDIRPDVVGEFEDGALLESFGQQGLGLFPMPTLEQAQPGGGVESLGMAEGVWEHYYAIASRRKLQHPALRAIVAQGQAL